MVLFDLIIQNSILKLLARDHKISKAIRILLPMQKEEISLSYISGDIPGCVKNVSANLEVYT